jgi:hypothetical protein
MATAARLSGYPVPDALPEVQLEPASWFSHRACQDHIPCPVYGLYEDHDVVYISQGDIARHFPSADSGI